MSNKKLYYTWTQFDEDCKKIAEWAAPKKFESIYGVPRGGLVLAVMLSHMMDLPIIFDEKKVQNMTLIVDDIVDTGKTAERLFARLEKRLPLASIHYHEDSSVEPDFYIHKKTQWVVYPWETEASSKYDGTV